MTCHPRGQSYGYGRPIVGNGHSPAFHIALVNELKLLSLRMGIDVWEARTVFGINGAAGATTSIFPLCDFHCRRGRILRSGLGLRVRSW